MMRPVMRFWAMVLIAVPLFGRAAEPERLVLQRLPCVRDAGALDHGMRQWAWEAMKRTSLLVSMETAAVDPERPELFLSPFAIWACRGAVTLPSEAAAANLRRFLVMGGFLLADDESAGDDPAFEESLRQALDRILPGRALEPVSPDHVLFRSFFLLRGTFGRRAARQLFGIELNGRLSVLVSRADLLGAVARDHFGNWEAICEPDGEDQRERTFRLLVNILQYATCLDYKDDRVHLPFILRRRKVLP